jgi:hypothetical protein
VKPTSAFPKEAIGGPASDITSSALRFLAAKRKPRWEGCRGFHRAAFAGCLLVRRGRLVLLWSSPSKVIRLAG